MRFGCLRLTSLCTSREVLLKGTYPTDIELSLGLACWVPPSLERGPDRTPCCTAQQHEKAPEA